MTLAVSIAQSGSNNVTMRNRIINGNMMIDQRYAGAATANTINDFTLDRWLAGQSVTGKMIVQQNAGSVTPPAGFVNYLGVTSQSAYSVGSSDYYLLRQVIEGFNMADLAWGTSNAKAVTLSFWVYSSLTGTFGGSLSNSAFNYSYPFTYSIPTANTWTQVSVTIAGPTSGTWVTNNGMGIRVYFGLGLGSTYSGTAGSWSANGYISVTGATSVVGTNGATFYITGVQLEAGTTATPFEQRLYGTELALCQRYLPAYNAESSSNTPYGSSVQGSTTTRMWTTFQFPVATRTAPTGVSISSTSHFIGAGQNTNMTLSAVNFQYASRLGAAIFFDGSGGTSQQGINLVSQNASGQILFTGCEL